MNRTADGAKRKVLLTGAAGHVGQVLAEAFAGRYNCLLTDARPLAQTHGFPFVQADLADEARTGELCRGVDTVIHLAAVHMASPWSELLSSNIVGLYHLFESASVAGCRRLIFASSIQVVDGYPKGLEVDSGAPVCPGSLYGASKAWGEAAASYYAHQRNLSAICLRLGWVQSRRGVERADDASRLGRVLTHDDLVQLFSAALEAPDDLRFGLYHGVSDNRWKRLDITRTKQELGYAPRDDAFALAPNCAMRFLLRIARKARRMVVDGRT